MLIIASSSSDNVPEDFKRKNIDKAVNPLKGIQTDVNHLK